MSDNFLKRIFLKAITGAVFFLLLSVILRDNFILWGISAGIFMSILNFSFLYIFSRNILEHKRKLWRLFYIGLIPAKLILLGGFMWMIVNFTELNAISFLVSINFIIFLFLWESFIVNRNILKV
jgi:hypothetical protein